MTREDIFTKIYKDHIWSGQSKSGTSSDPIRTSHLVSKIIQLIEEYNIQSIVDAPCGDFIWVKDIIEKTKISYIGYDIVKELIEDNQKLYSQEYNALFQKRDITKNTLAKADLMLCRDCLVHLSFESINSFLRNFIASGCSYLLTTTFTYSHRGNADLVEDIIGWRPLNLQNAPFNFRDPLKTIQEVNVEADRFSDKSLCLWAREQIVSR